MSQTAGAATGASHRARVIVDQSYRSH